MFNDGRSRKVVFIAHCLLNQNSISDGTAVYPAAFKEIIDYFFNADIGVIQMPCPELSCLGLDRGNIFGANSPVVVENTRILKEMRKEIPNKKLNKLVDDVIQQILEYHRYQFEIIGIIGANRSPNCGVNTTSDNDMEINGMGLFMDKISIELKKENIIVPMIGIKANDNILEIIGQLL